jgi:hypothetical protein
MRRASHRLPFVALMPQWASKRHSDLFGNSELPADVPMSDKLNGSVSVHGVRALRSLSTLDINSLAVVKLNLYLETSPRS